MPGTHPLLDHDNRVIDLPSDISRTSDRPEGDPERFDDAYATRSTTSKHHNPPRRSVPFRDESIDAATSSDVLWTGGQGLGA